MKYCLFAAVMGVAWMLVCAESASAQTGLTNESAPQSRYPQQEGSRPLQVAQPASAVTPIRAAGQAAASGPRPVAPTGVVQVLPGPPANTAQPAAQPRVPFQLTPAEVAYRDQFLKVWETESGKVITFKCEFDRWEYLRAFTPTGRDIPLVKGRGTLAYAKPDKGSFQVDEIHRWKEEKQPDGTSVDQWLNAENEVGERWVCDGKDVYNYAHKEKQLQVSPIPPDLQGKAIVDGPLPFLFGAKADKLKQRYWIRVTKADDQEVWLDAYPKHLADAQNYSRVEMILNRNGLMPTAMQVYLPNGDRNVYMFGKATVNSQLDRFFGVFKPPRTPFGWKKVVLESPKLDDPNRAGPRADPTLRDARRPIPRSRY